LPPFDNIDPKEFDQYESTKLVYGSNYVDFVRYGLANSM